MKKLFSFRCSLRLHFIDDRLELLGGERRVFGDSLRKRLDHGGSLGRSQYLGIVRSGQRSSRVVVEDERSTLGQLLETIHRRKQQIKQLSHPLLNGLARPVGDVSSALEHRHGKL